MLILWLGSSRANRTLVGTTSKDQARNDAILSPLQASIDVSAQVGLFDVLDADAGGELSVRELLGFSFQCV